MAAKSLDILFVSRESGGHMNATIGIAQILIGAGHRAYFVCTELWKGRLAKYGIVEVVIDSTHMSSNGKPDSYWSDVYLNAGATKDWSTLKKWFNIFSTVFPTHMSDAKELDRQLEVVIGKVKPDLIVIDHVLTIPAIELSGIPWINSSSYNPLTIADDERTPPQRSGLPTYDAEKEWTAFRNAMNQVYEPLTDPYNEYIVSRGLPPLPKYRYFRDSPFLNIYGYPIELDYLDVRPMPDNWLRFDNLKRTETSGQVFEIPEQLRQRPGKLIYLSLGTLCSGDLALMQRLIGLLSECPHRVIVSMGPKHESIQLASNMWGQRSVPQIQVLPVVDLFLTHGGNNSLTEGLFFGTKMLVMPLFSDQSDNAQRIEEKGLGLKLNPHNCTKEQLLSAIDRLLNDNELAKKLKNISQRIQSENSIAKLPLIIEQKLKLWNNS